MEEKLFDSVLRLDFFDEKNCSQVFLALSCKTRRDILRLLIKNEKEVERSLTVWQICEKLNVPVSTVSNHLKVLTQSGLIYMKPCLNTRGNEKMVMLQHRDINVMYNSVPNDFKSDDLTINIPIGSYMDFGGFKHCGMASNEGPICRDNELNLFYNENRHKAQLIWIGESGYISYRIPLSYYFIEEITQLSFSLEICSEIENFDNNYKSDITFSLNNTELLTYTSPGDFGDRRGRLTPDWWPNYCTQYGQLKNIVLTKQGVYLDGKMVNEKVNVDIVKDSVYCDFKIEVKKKAKNVGGFNLFGEKFGDVPCSISLNIKYKTKK